MELNKILNGITPLSAVGFQQLSDICEEIHIEKNRAVIESGKISRFIYFLKSGTCRIFYPKDEKQVVLDLCLPGDSLISLNSYIHSKPGYEQIETLENSILIRFNCNELQQLFQTSIEIANWGRKMIEQETLKIENRLMQQLFKSASERYQELLEKKPDILKRIKLGYIASYLGVSQVTLSRIRGKVK